MRYRVVNLQMSGLLEDYQQELAAFKQKLYQPSGFRGFNPPPTTYPPSTPPPPPPMDAGTGAKYFPPPPPLMPPMVATGQPPAPRPQTGPTEVKVFVPPAPPLPPQRPSGLPLNPPNTISTGIPPKPYDFLPPPQITDYYPPIPTQQSCPEGYTWTPSGCKKDVVSEPNRPPISSLQPPPAPVASSSLNPGGINSGGYSWNSAPGVNAGGGMAPSVPTGQCPPGQFWDGRKCRGSVGSMPTIPGGMTSPSNVSPSITAPSGMDAPAGLVNLGEVPIRGSLSGYVRPRMVRIVR